MSCLSDKPTWPKPNEWGDIFAGLFAPVAFLWLVLGFRQQGRGLQQNTRALELQAKELEASVAALNLQAAELKNSVEQQQALVKVTRDQFEAAMEEQERRRKAEHASTQPRFVLRPDGSNSAPEGGSRFSFVLVNEGETVTNLNVTVTPRSQDAVPLINPVLRRGNDWRLWIRFERWPDNEPVTFRVAFQDVHSALGEQYFIAKQVNGGIEVTRTIN